jgi:hypothetical protein
MHDFAETTIERLTSAMEVVEQEHADQILVLEDEIAEKSVAIFSMQGEGRPTPQPPHGAPPQTLLDARLGGAAGSGAQCMGDWRDRHDLTFRGAQNNTQPSSARGPCVCLFLESQGHRRAQLGAVTR